MRYLVEALRALGNPERLRLFFLLGWQGDGLCVCELVEALDLPQYQVSKHLRVLRRTGLIESTRVGRWAYYSVAGSPRAHELSDFLQAVVPHSEVSTALKRLQASISRREGGRCVEWRNTGRV